MDFCAFRNLNLIATEFRECSLKECSFMECDLSKSKFEGSDLQGTQFSNCKLIQADFRNATNISLEPDFNQLKGAKFQLEQLPGLLEKYQIKIE